MLKYINPWYWIYQRGVEQRAEEQRIADEEYTSAMKREAYYAEHVRTLDEMKQARLKRIEAESGLTAVNAVRKAKEQTKATPRPGYVSDYATNSDNDALMMFAVTPPDTASSYSPSNSAACDSGSSSDTSSPSSSCDSGSSGGDSSSW